MSLHTMPYNAGDFLADTMGLSAEETGAYHLLLLCLWRSNGEPLPLDHKKLCRMARCTPRKWTKVWESIRHYFTIEGDVFYQKRVRQTLVDVQVRVSANRVNGSLGGIAKSLKTKEPDLANATNSLKRERSHIKTKINTKEKKETNKESFDEFWKAYPKKVGRGAAEKSYLKALGIDPHETLIKAVRGYPFSPERQFIPLPTTWLNQERWKDEFESSSAEQQNPIENWKLEDWRKRLGPVGGFGAKHAMQNWCLLTGGNFPHKCPAEILTEYYPEEMAA